MQKRYPISKSRIEPHLQSGQFHIDDIIGQMLALFVITVAAAESAIGLAILVAYYRVRGTIGVEYVRLMKN